MAGFGVLSSDCKERGDLCIYMARDMATTEEEEELWHDDDLHTRDGGMMEVGQFESRMM